MAAAASSQPPDAQQTAGAGDTASPAAPPASSDAQANAAPAAWPLPGSGPRSLLAGRQIVSFYGNPLSPAMGVLGEGTEDEMLAHLKQQAQAYQALAGDTTVVPAIHLVYEVAQRFTLDDNLYLYRTDDKTVRHFIELTRQQHMLLFLDLQIGRSELAGELLQVLPYLREPHVHLAIDPEFATLPGYRPGQFIGALDAATIDAALGTIERLAERYDLPNKIVIVHQFQDYMLTHKEKLNFSLPRVDLVLDMDGFGDPSGKLEHYDEFVKQAGVKFGGIKLFYTHDTNLLSEAQVEALDPRPSIVIYQ